MLLLKFTLKIHRQSNGQIRVPQFSAPQMACGHSGSWMRTLRKNVFLKTKLGNLILVICVYIYFYRPQRSCGQGNIFTSVCHSVHRGVCLSACWDTTPPRGTPTPTRKETPPRKEAPPWEGGIPLGRRHTPRHTVNERPVRILLECILVTDYFYHLHY